MKLEGTPVFLDVEGLPDRDFYYLIGIRFDSGQGAIEHTLWANSVDDEQRIWNDFLSILALVTNPVIIHYGSYETIFLSRMRKRYGIAPEHSMLPGVIETAINLLSVIYGRVYFPAYTNGLKDIARCLDFHWSEADISCLTSIVWRYKWEEGSSGDLKDKLTTYNAEDCAALEMVTNSIRAFCKIDVGSSAAAESNFVDVASIKREKVYPFGTNDFALPALDQINKAGYWDYQRNRIFLRTDNKVRAAVQRTAKRKQHSVKINQTIQLDERPSSCQDCGSHTVDRYGWVTRIIHDLKFSKSGIKKWVIKYLFGGSSYPGGF